MTDRKSRGVGPGILIAILAFPAGYIVLTAIGFCIHKLWFELPLMMNTPTLWVFTLAMPVLAGALVYWLRNAGNNGHSPLAGITIAPLIGREYPYVLGAIVASLLGGLVIGPEAAMVCTGAAIGTVIAARTQIETKAGVAVGSLAAILALFVSPVQQGTFSVASSYNFLWSDLLGGAVVAVVTAIVLLVGRKLALAVFRLTSAGQPHLKLLMACGLLVGLIAMIYHSITGGEIRLIMTSGEYSVKDLLALGGVGLILLTVALKWLVYSLSMGSGFRGGPYFPVIFIGAGIGGICELLFPDYGHGATVAGMVAAVIYLAHPKLIAAVLIAVPLALLGGGPELIPGAIVAAIIAWLVPAVKFQEAVSKASATDENPIAQSA